MNLNIRLANINDIKDVFMLANDDIVRANSINTSQKSNTMSMSVGLRIKSAQKIRFFMF